MHALLRVSEVYCLLYSVLIKPLAGIAVKPSLSFYFIVVTLHILDTKIKRLTI